MPPHPLTNFEIQKSIKFRTNLPNLKIMVYVIKLSEYKEIGTKWIDLV